MPVSTLYVIHGVQTPSSFYSQIEDGRVATESEVLQVLPSGHFHPMFTNVLAQRPVIEFSTPQIATLLGEVGSIGADTSSGNVDLYEKQVDNLGTRVDGASLMHNRYRCAATLFYCASITAPHRGIATARARMMAAYDGTNEPIVPAGSLALSGTPAAAENFGVGPVELGGTLLNGVQQVDIEFGVRLIQAGAESEVWDTFIAVAEIVPRFRIQTHNAAAFAAYGLDGTALSGDGLELWLRKKNADGTNVANGTASHIKFTVSNGIIVPEETAGGKNDPDLATVTVYPRAADANSPSFSISTASTIA